MRWVFSRLFRARLPRYEAIAETHGYTISTTELARVRNAADFDDLVCMALEREARL